MSLLLQFWSLFFHASLKGELIRLQKLAVRDLTGDGLGTRKAELWGTRNHKCTIPGHCSWWWNGCCNPAGRNECFPSASADPTLTLSQELSLCFLRGAGWSLSLSGKWHGPWLLNIKKVLALALELDSLWKGSSFVLYTLASFPMLLFSVEPQTCCLIVSSNCLTHSRWYTAPCDLRVWSHACAEVLWWICGYQTSNSCVLLGSSLWPQFSGWSVNRRNKNNVYAWIIQNGAGKGLQGHLSVVIVFLWAGSAWFKAPPPSELKTSHICW